MVAGECERVDEEPEKSRDPQWQGPGGEKVQGKVFNPDRMNVVKYLP